MPEPRKPTVRQIEVVKQMLDTSIRRRRDAIERENQRPSYDELVRWHERHPDPRERHDRMVARKLAPAKKEIEDLMYQARMGFISVLDFDAKARALAEKIAPRTAAAQE